MQIIFRSFSFLLLLLLLHKGLFFKGSPYQSLVSFLSNCRLLWEAVPEVLKKMQFYLLSLLEMFCKGGGSGILKIHRRKDYNGGQMRLGIIILQQSSMQGKNKYVSSLDLKYLDAKFIAIHDSQFQMSTNLNEIRKSKTSELPSIFKSKHESDDNTLYTSALTPGSRLESLESRPQLRYKSVRRSSIPHSDDELREVEKYKRMIAKIKSDNELLHKEITNLYRQEHLTSKEPKKKAIKNIIQVGKASAPVLHKRSFPEARQFECVYQNLSKGDNPYRQESLQLQKRFINSNFHKNFENFLQAHKRRVPEFIKNIR